VALNHDRDFMEIAEETDARQALHRVSFAAIILAFLLGFGLISLLVYGRILTDSNVVELSTPAAVPVPEASSRRSTP
jgi:hypothetical protein